MNETKPSLPIDLRPLSPPGHVLLHGAALTDDERGVLLACILEYLQAHPPFRINPATRQPVIDAHALWSSIRSQHVSAHKTVDQALSVAGVGSAVLELRAVAAALYKAGARASELRHEMAKLEAIAEALAPKARPAVETPPALASGKAKARQ